MRQVLRLAANDLRLTLRDRPALLWMFVFPVAMMWLFGQMGGGRTERPKISLAVVDQDHGWIARQLVEELKGERIVLKEAAGRAAEGATDRIRTLIIPEGFTEMVARGEAQKLKFEKTEGANQEFDLAAQAHIFRAVARVLAGLAELAAADGDGALPPPERAVTEYRALAGRPPLVSLDVATAGKGRPVPGGFAQSVPGILAMTVLMMTVIYGAVFLTVEKRTGMLRRQSALPLTRLQIYLGKLTGRLAVAGAQTIVLLLAGRYLFGLSWGESPGALVLVLGCYAVAVAGLSTMLGALLSTPEQASGFGWILSMMMAALGGCWWPGELMPRWLWTVAHVTPTAWAMDALHGLISFGRGMESVVLPCAALLAIGAVCAAVGARFLRFD
jgi:ABC-2 type transport system permease protein